VEKLREETEARENYRKYLDTDAGEAVTNTEEFECLICYAPIPPGDGLILRGCLHEFCKYVR
jgi:RanBP-type and C3HC4-type zinc finger-containing protein 1